MGISIDDINAAILGAVEWDFQNAALTDLDVDDYANGTMQDYAHKVIDRAMIYTSDIFETWERYGRPDVESMGEHDSIMSAITRAVYETLREDVDTWAILETWVESHAELLPADIASDDVEEAFGFLAGYARSEH